MVQVLIEEGMRKNSSRDNYAFQVRLGVNILRLVSQK